MVEQLSYVFSWLLDRSYGPYCADCLEVVLEDNAHIDLDIESADPDEITCKRCKKVVEATNNA